MHLLLISLTPYLVLGQNIINDSLINSNNSYQVIEEQPSFPNGMQGFYNYISDNMYYPKGVNYNKVHGKVYVKFVIDKDGSIIKESVKDLSSHEADSLRIKTDDLITFPPLINEAKRLIIESPNWIPGKQNGIPVRVLMIVPILFRK